MTISVAEEANTSLAGNKKACPNRRSGEDECGNGKETRTGDGSIS